MALDTALFKEVGGPGNAQSGGQIYSVHSEDDAIATMVASGYFDGLATPLNVDDILLLAGTDGVAMVKVAAITSGVVTVKSWKMAAGKQALSGAGAVDIVTDTTEVTSTGVDALTIVDGVEGQIKTIIMIVDGGTATLTPTTGLGYSTIAFADAGDSVVLQFASAGGWAIIGAGGLAGGPVAA